VAARVTGERDFRMLLSEWRIICCMAAPRTTDGALCTTSRMAPQIWIDSMMMAPRVSLAVAGLSRRAFINIEGYETLFVES